MQQPSSEASIHSVRRYYEQNTRLFRVGGLGNRSYAVHRALWDASVTTFDAALQRVNALVLEEVQIFLKTSHVGRLNLIDLGCGVGGTLAYCARALPESHLAGVTLSMTQARIARRILPRARAAVITADFHNLPWKPCFHIAVAIEAFAHAHNLRHVWEQAHAVLVPGGRLIICDDTIARPPSSDVEERWLAAFRDGWRVPGVCTR
ncbi:MAG: SAM-dependent methyltransferase, partial [Roseiflexus sp.]